MQWPSSPRASTGSSHGVSCSLSASALAPSSGEWRAAGYTRCMRAYTRSAILASPTAAYTWPRRSPGVREP